MHVPIDAERAQDAWEECRDFLQDLLVQLEEPTAQEEELTGDDTNVPFLWKANKVHSPC